MAYVIAEPCIGTKDTACFEACPVDAIHPGKETGDFASVKQLYIDPGECICCAACVPVCPANAIFAEEDLPARWKDFVQINADYYRRSGSKDSAISPSLYNQSSGPLHEDSDAVWTNRTDSAGEDEAGGHAHA